MASAHNTNRSTVDRPLTLQARGDITATAVSFSGQQAYVLKDPLALELFHLTEEEYFLFQMLRESVSLSRLRRKFEERFAPRRVTHEALQQGLNHLYSQGLLLGDSPAQGRELLKRSEQRQRSERLQSLGRLMSFRLGSVDATSLVDGLYSKVRWLFSLPMMLFAMLACFYAGWILLGHGSEVWSRFPSLAELAQPRYWLLWVATVVVVKVIHELAHATTCHRFGGRCHEMGLLLLVFIPCLYCDVTDAWRLPNKWHRIAISAAGMIAELAIASLALIAWWHTEPGLLHTWCLSLVVVCSVGTLLVNLNPLLRYDGYYILSDLVEVPNLAGRSQGLLPAALRRWLLGQPGPVDPLLSKRQRQGLVVYAVATRVYLTLVLLAIFAMLFSWATPHRLENLVYTLAGVVLAGIAIRPLPGLCRMLQNPSFRAKLRWTRAFLLGAGVSTAMALLFYWPITRTVSGPIVFVPAKGQTVYATKAGELKFALPAGTRVKQGDLIARLAEPEIEIALARQEGELEVRRARYAQLGAMRAWDTQASQLLPTARAAVADAESQLDELQNRGEQLLMKSPVSGVIIAPPQVKSTAKDRIRLPGWSGSPLEARNLGCWIESGTVFCTVAKSGQLEALLAIEQADVAAVAPGQKVRIRLDSAPAHILEGQVLQVARRAVQPQDRRQKPEAAYHLVQVQLDQQDQQWLVGIRGQAKIETSRGTLSQLIYREFSQMLRIPW